MTRAYPSRSMSRSNQPPALRREWFATILEQLPSGVLVVEAPSARVAYWNAQVAHTWPSFLHSPASLDGVTVCQLIRSDGRPYTNDEWPLTRALTTGTPIAEEVQFLASNGTRTVMDVRCTPVRVDDDSISAVIAVFQDVTGRRRIEQALQASQARYENLYQDAPDMFASVAVDSEHVVQCNETLIRVSGYRRDELMGRPMRELHAASCWPDLDAALERVGRDGYVRDTELQLLCKNGKTLEVSLSVAAIRDEKENLYYRSTWRDITERKRVDAVLHEKQVELARSRRELQALARRLFTVQEDERRRISRELHDDLNQRLAVLTLDIEELHQRLPRSRSATAGRLLTIRDRVVELSDAVHTLAYQLHASILDDLGLTAALESYLVDYRQREGVKVAWKREPIGPLPTEVASCLYRVAQEALRNVARHASATQVTLSLEQAESGVSMVIADDGAGFEVPSSQPLGASLGIVGMEERVRLADGRFSLVSRPGGGTQVDVWVPIPQAGGENT